MKMGTIASPGPYDAGTLHPRQPERLRLPLISHYASLGGSLLTSRASGYPSIADVPIHPGDRRDVPEVEINRSLATKGLPAGRGLDILFERDQGAYPTRQM